MMCSGLSVRVYMPGRCLTGSSPFRTRIEPSEYSVVGLTAMARIVVCRADQTGCAYREQGRRFVTVPGVICKQTLNWLHFSHELTTQKSIDGPGSDLRSGHRHPVDGHPPWLWPVAAAHHPGPRLAAPDLCPGDRDPEPVLGTVRHLCRHGRRPPGGLQGLAGWGPAVCTGPGRHGTVDQPPGFCPDHRGLDRRRPGRHHLCRDLRRAGPPDLGRETVLGHGRRRCGGLVRAVPDGASGRTADCPAGLEGSLVGPEPDGVDDRAPGFQGGAPIKRQQTVAQALAEAFKYPSFQLLMAGYFVCGFQVVFIGVHMPSYLKDKGLSPQVASYALALIGLFNVFGTYIAGTLGQRMAKKNILAFIYFARAVVISIFLLVPLSPASVYVFAAVMGALWLSTVPPTNATIAQIFGVQHLSMLGGFVFFSHQIGSFMGVWLGGYLYDRTGSYDIVWYLAIALGVFAGLVNLPVREAPIRRPQHPMAA